MPRVTIDRLRHLVRALRYSISFHATDEMRDDELTIPDLETIIHSGAIVERQRDKSTAETKYVIRGIILRGDDAECVVKIVPTGSIFGITVYLD